jgi:hypothetical protein
MLFLLLFVLVVSPSTSSRSRNCSQGMLATKSSRNHPCK